MNAQQGAWLRTVLEALGYAQPATRILCDNQCAVGLATNTVKARSSKSIDIRFHWIRDRIRQGQFQVSWIKGATNLADFFTKALPAHRHRELKPLLVRGVPDPANPSLPKQLQRSRAHRANTAMRNSSSIISSGNVYSVRATTD
jgi:hypothetical protein